MARPASGASWPPPAVSAVAGASSIPVYPSGAPVQVAELTGSGKDSTSSIGNSTNLSMCFYEHKNYGGLEFRIDPGEWWATIPSWTANKISSYRPC
jgi:hypothetical protein